MRKTVVTALLAIVILTGCNILGPGKINDTDVRKVLYPHLIEMLEAEGKNAAQLVDVRMPAQYEQGHLPGAINVPLTEIRPNHPLLSKKRPIVVYSASWADGFSNSAAKKLLLSGYNKDNVLDFRGGLDYWVKEGGRVVIK